MTGMDKFDCTGCGACCKVLPKPFLDFFKLPESPSGGCGHLLPDNRCAIYDTRPWVCDVRKVWEVRGKVSWDEYKAQSRDACAILQKVVGVDAHGNRLADKE